MRVLEPASRNAIDRWWTSAVSPVGDEELVEAFCTSLAQDTYFRYHQYDVQTEPAWRVCFHLNDRGLVAIVEFSEADRTAEIKSVFVEDNDDLDPFALP